MRITRVKQSAGRPTAVGGRNSRGQPWTAIMAVDGRDGCGRPRTTVATVDGNEQLLTAVDGSDGCGRMRTAVDRRGRPSMAMMLADSPGLRWRDAQGRGQVQEWRRSGHGRVLHTSSVWCYHQHATHETFLHSVLYGGIVQKLRGNKDFCVIQFQKYNESYCF